MHHEINKAIYDAYPLEEKGDALGGYLYLKYTDLFMSTIVRIVGLQVKEPAYPVDEGIAQMMELVSQQVIDAGATRETSIYHGKVVKLLDAIKLVTQKENLHPVPSRFDLLDIDAMKSQML